jgi:hypothetical protein
VLVLVLLRPWVIALRLLYALPWPPHGSFTSSSLSSST